MKLFSWFFESGPQNGKDNKLRATQIAKPFSQGYVNLYLKVKKTNLYKRSGYKQQNEITSLIEIGLKKKEANKPIHFFISIKTG